MCNLYIFDVMDTQVWSRLAFVCVVAMPGNTCCHYSVRPHTARLKVAMLSAMPRFVLRWEHLSGSRHSKVIITMCGTRHATPSILQLIYNII